MKDHTFGNSKEAEVLLKLVEKHDEESDETVKSTVQSRLSKFREILNNLDKIEKESHQKYLATLLFKDFEKKTEENPAELPELIKNYMINVLNISYREYIKNL